ncbi:MAG: methyltransferase [Chitinophagales bacterium]|jgi:SAM-dependent methyltransferase|nr:methyltransferase [Chitinophagales bacterium]MBP6154576.1 methyltransferase [Chitinophagales bacterium]
MSELKCANGEVPTQLDASFWDELWKNKITGWDLKKVSPPLKAYFDAMTCKNKSILIPGCGNAYEAAYLLEQGFKNITVIDISATLVQQLIEKHKTHIGKELTVIAGDFFKHSGKYDFIIEQTFFCALDRNRREEYASKMQTLLKDNGKLAGLLFSREFEVSPPHGGNKEEYESVFSDKFTIEKMDICETSVTPRKGTELFFEMSLKL